MRPSQRRRGDIQDASAGRQPAGVSPATASDNDWTVRVPDHPEPQTLRNLASCEDGLIIAAGATASGKTTTLAALVDIIAKTRPVHLLTIADPLEHPHPPTAAKVTQYDLGDGLTFEEAWETARRLKPDVVLFEEMRHIGDIDICLKLASSGLLVLTSMHSSRCRIVCERIASASGDHGRSLLAETLRAVIAQKLIPSARDRHRRHVAAETMMMNDTYRTLIEPGGSLTSIDTQPGQRATQHGLGAGEAGQRSQNQPRRRARGSTGARRLPGQHRHNPLKSTAAGLRGPPRPATALRRRVLAAVAAAPITAPFV